MKLQKSASVALLLCLLGLFSFKHVSSGLVNQRSGARSTRYKPFHVQLLKDELAPLLSSEEESSENEVTFSQVNYIPIVYWHGMGELKLN